MPMERKKKDIKCLRTSAKELKKNRHKKISLSRNSKKEQT